MQRYYKLDDPTKIPVPGNKLIEEYFGNVATQTDEYSIAHMVASSGWSEPAQTPDFDEITIMIKGKMEIVVDDNEVVELKAGESFVSKKGTQVRYANPYEEDNEYWSICIPAFNVKRAARKD